MGLYQAGYKICTFNIPVGILRFEIEDCLVCQNFYQFCGNRLRFVLIIPIADYMMLILLYANLFPGSGVQQAPCN